MSKQPTKSERELIRDLVRDMADSANTHRQLAAKRVMRDGRSLSEEDAEMHLYHAERLMVGVRALRAHLDVLDEVHAARVARQAEART